MSPVADDLDPAAVERAVGVVTAHQRTSQGYCSHDDCHRAWVVWTSRHVVQCLTAAGLLVTPEHDAQVAARAVAGVVARLRRLAADVDGPLRPQQWRYVAAVVEEADRIERQEEGQ